MSRFLFSCHHAAFTLLEASVGIGPTMRVLQTLALPLGDDAELLAFGASTGSVHEARLPVNPKQTLTYHASLPG